MGSLSADKAAKDFGRGERERLPKRRRTVTYEMELDSHKLYVSLGLYPDGRVGELFVATAKDGSMLRTSLSAWAIATSKAIQYGMSVREVVRTYRGIRCDDGFIQCSDVPAIHRKPCSSSWDAVAQLIDAETLEDGRHKDYPSGAPAQEMHS